MIELQRAEEIATWTLPRIYRFPRNHAAQVAIIAQCAKLLSSRCATDEQAEKFASEYSASIPRWYSVDHFAEALAVSLGEWSAADIRSYQAHAHNCLTEPLRCRDKIIGWCGVSFPQALIDRARRYDQLTPFEQAQLGRDAMLESQAIERAQWEKIKILPAVERAQLEEYARREWPQFVEPEPRGAREAMCLSFEEWRKLTCG